MTHSFAAARAERARNLVYLSTPALWPAYPFLPVVNRTGPAAFGVLADVRGLFGVYGFGSTVVLANLFAVPATLSGLLALPRCVFDSSEEVYLAGWRVD